MMIIRVSGKCKDVFGAVKKLAHDTPNKTIGDIIEEKK